MEDVPPSYQSAVDREAWNVIAPWIPSGDLCSACLVCRKWHSIFVPFLWGDPARHFGIQNDAVFVALTRFKKTLRKARASVRALTHTLHLPPALSEIYGGPNREWLRDVLDYLPNLQSLIVAKLPFFDHHSLFALRTPSNRRRSLDGDQDEIPVYGLKLLLAGHEPNATSVSIATALPCFQALVYLDLSYTTPARDAAVLAALGKLYDLQVLKLRGVGLRDSEAEVLANSIGIKVRLLDLRENFLTDMTVRSLIQACFMPTDVPANNSRVRARHVEDWPVGIAPGPELFSLDTLRNEELDHELLKQLTNPLTGRLAFEDIPHRGLTHLYISDNYLSVEGLSNLLQSERLHVLDGGSVDHIKTIARTRSLSSPTGYSDEVRFPGAEKLIPVLAQYAAKNLTYLRVGHAVVTAQLELSDYPGTPAKSSTELRALQPQAVELPPDERFLVEAPAPAHYAVEMPSDPEQRYELDATPAQPRHELIGDIIQFAISPPIGDKPEDPNQLAETLSPVKGEGPYAPEVVENGERHSDEDSEDGEVILNATGTGLTARKSRKEPRPDTNGTLHSPGSTTTPDSGTLALKNPVQAPMPPSRPSITQRTARIDTLLAKRPPPGKPLSFLHPSNLPNLRTLILTDLPTLVPQSSQVIPTLKSFISACADEAALAFLRARTDYSLPPGRARHAAELDHARSLFALRTLVLEMAQPGSKSPSEARGWHHNKQRLILSKSSTGDRDSENLWSAAENDFSFFGEEGEEQDECGIYENEPDKYFPTAHFDDKILITPQDSNEDVRRSSSPHGSFGSVHQRPMRSPTILRSPRELPLGRNRRRSSGSGDFDRDRDSLRDRIFGSASGTTRRGPGSLVSEMPGSSPSTPIAFQLPPTSNPNNLAGLNVQYASTPEPDEPMVDVISELAAWRRERKKEYEDAVIRWKLSRGATGGHSRAVSIDHAVGGTKGFDIGLDERDMPFVEGHWKGEIRVIRTNPAPKDRTGLVDLYGNYFEKGYLYP